MEPQLPNQPDTEEQRQRRIDALRQLAAESTLSTATTATSLADMPTPTPATAPGMPPAPAFERVRRPLRWRLALVSLLLVLVVAGAGYALLPIFYSQAPGEPPIPAKLTIDPSADNMDCPSGLIWAPDGSRVGIVGTADLCNGSSTTPSPPFLLIYDTHTGKKLKTIDLGGILTGYGLFAQFIFDGDIAWSPDGKQIAVESSPPSVTPAGPFPVDLVLIPLDGGHPHVVTGTFAQDSLVVWNVRAGRQAGTLSASDLRPALSYRWTPDGRITPDVPFPTTSGYTGRLTNPGDFSYWQDGTFQSFWGDQGNNPGFRQPPLAEQFQSTLTEWSPDGQFLVTGINQSAFVYARGKLDPKYCPPANVPPGCALAPVPLPDPAFATVLTAIRQPLVFHSGSDTYYQWDQAGVAWSLDGQTLATILPADQFQDQHRTPGKSTAITLLSTKTGQPLKQVRYTCPTYTSLSTFAGCDNLTTGWSPTGAQLALLDPGADRLTLWKM